MWSILIAETVWLYFIVTTKKLTALEGNNTLPFSIDFEVLTHAFTKSYFDLNVNFFVRCDVEVVTSDYLSP